MALKGETLASGAPATCPDCQMTPRLEVLISGAGYFIGTRCLCGPYTRESEYFQSRIDAEVALRSNAWTRRTTEFRGRL